MIRRFTRWLRDWWSLPARVKALEERETKVNIHVKAEPWTQPTSERVKDVMEWARKHHPPSQPSTPPRPEGQ